MSLDFVGLTRAQLTSILNGDTENGPWTEALVEERCAEANGLRVQAYYTALYNHTLTHIQAIVSEPSDPH